jgi:hypothetical protein
MSHASTARGRLASSRTRFVLGRADLVLLGLLVAAPAAAGDVGTRTICASTDALSLSVAHQGSIRVCGTVPVRISLWNRSEKRPTVLQKVVVGSAARGVLTEVEVGKDLPASGEDLDTFCRECTDAVKCGDAEGCGGLYADLQSRGYKLDAEVPLAAAPKEGARESACAGEELDVEVYLTVSDEQVVLRRRLLVVDAASPAPAALEEGIDSIVVTGALPHPAGWFAGDQHSHTSYEKDAGFCIWEWPDSMSSMIGAGLAMDLDWQFFTDHSFGIDGTIWTNAYNECATYNTQHPADSYRCLYGEEVSAGNRSGQFTISHLLQLPRNADSVGYYADGCGFFCNNCRSEQTVINDINNKGGMVFLNHVYDTDFSWADWNVTGYRGMEVLNSIDGTWGAEDESSFTKWKDLLASGKNVVGLSDSDAHYTADVGHAFTYCRLAEMSTSGIRAALDEGRCAFGNGPLVTFAIGGKQIGDSLAACPGTATVSIDAYRGDAAMGYLDTIGIYVNGSLRDQVSFASDQTEFHGTRQIDLTSADRYLFLGVQDRGAAKAYKAWTNPLWLSISPDNGPDVDGDTYTTCENDCDDNDPQVHPGAQELCDFKDNDCDGATDEGFGVPAGTTGLAFEANKQTIGWAAVLLADRYDVVRGDLQALRSSGGIYASTLTSCLENDGADALLDDPPEPAPDQAFYYLVRAQAACKSGTFNSGQPGQVGDRDPGIGASPYACP